MVLEYPRYHTSMNTPVQSHTHLKKYFTITKIEERKRKNG